MSQHTVGNHRRCFVARFGMEPFDGFSLRAAFEQVVNETKTFLEFCPGSRDFSRRCVVTGQDLMRR